MATILEQVQNGDFDPAKMFTGNPEKFLEVKSAFQSITNNLTKETCIKFVTAKIIPTIFNKNIDNSARDEAVEVGLSMLNIVNVTTLPPKEQEVVFALIEETYAKTIGDLRDNNYQNWDKLWIFLIRYCHEKLHTKLSIANKLLRVVEVAFRNSTSIEQRLKAYDCWTDLIDNCSLNMTHMCTAKQIKLLMTPMKAKFSRLPIVIIKRCDTFVYLLEKLQEKATLCLKEFLEFCFGPFEEKTDLDKTKQGWCVTEVWVKSTKVLLRILGHCHKDASECVSTEELKLSSSIITQENFSNFSEILINSCIECCILVKEWNEDTANINTILKCLWISLFKFINKSTSETQVKCITHINLSLRKLLERRTEVPGVHILFQNLIDIFTKGQLPQDVKEILCEGSLKILGLPLELCTINKEVFVIFISRCFEGEVSPKISKLGSNFLQTSDLSTGNTEVLYQIWLKCNFAINANNLILFMWPIQHVVKDKEFTDSEGLNNKWTKMLKEIKTETMKITILQETEKMFTDNPLTSSGIIALLYAMSKTETTLSKEIVTKLLRVTELVLTFPNISQGDTEKLSELVAGYFSRNQTFYKAENIDELIDKLCGCLEHLVTIHKTFAILDQIFISLREGDVKILVKFGKKLLSFLETLLLNDDNKITTIATKLIQLLEVKEKAPEPLSTSRSMRILNLTKITPKVVSSKRSKEEKRHVPLILSRTKIPVKVLEHDEAAQDYVKIDTEVALNVNNLNEHQKEVLAKRPEDIPALYSDLTESRSQDLFSQDIDVARKENNMNKSQGEIVQNDLKETINSVHDSKRKYERKSKNENKIDNENAQKKHRERTKHRDELKFKHKDESKLKNAAINEKKTEADSINDEAAENVEINKIEDIEINETKLEISCKSTKAEEEEPPPKLEQEPKIPDTQIQPNVKRENFEEPPPTLDREEECFTPPTIEEPNVLKTKDVTEASSENTNQVQKIATPPVSRRGRKRKSEQAPKPVPVLTDKVYNTRERKPKVSDKKAEGKSSKDQKDNEVENQVQDNQEVTQRNEEKTNGSSEGSERQDIGKAPGAHESHDKQKLEVRVNLVKEKIKRKSDIKAKPEVKRRSKAKNKNDSEQSIDGDKSKNDESGTEPRHAVFIANLDAAIDSVCKRSRDWYKENVLMVVGGNLTDGVKPPLKPQSLSVGAEATKKRVRKSKAKPESEETPEQAAEQLEPLEEDNSIKEYLDNITRKSSKEARKRISDCSTNSQMSEGEEQDDDDNSDFEVPPKKRRKRMKNIDDNGARRRKKDDGTITDDSQLMAELMKLEPEVQALEESPGKVRKRKSKKAEASDENTTLETTTSDVYSFTTDGPDEDGEPKVVKKKPGRKTDLERKKRRLGTFSKDDYARRRKKKPKRLGEFHVTAEDSTLPPLSESQSLRAIPSQEQETITILITRSPPGKKSWSLEDDLQKLVSAESEELRRLKTRRSSLPDMSDPRSPRGYHRRRAHSLDDTPPGTPSLEVTRPGGAKGKRRSKRSELSQKRASIYPPTRKPSQRLKRNLAGSPVTSETPERTKELLNDTSDISPITSEHESSTPKAPEVINMRGARLLQLANPNLVVKNEKWFGGKRSVETTPQKRTRPVKQQLVGHAEHSGSETRDDLLTFSRVVPSPLVTPASSILKRKYKALKDTNSGSGTRKRVNFPDPAITAKKVFIKGFGEYPGGVNEDERDAVLFGVSELLNQSVKNSEAFKEALLRLAANLTTREVVDVITEYLTDLDANTIHDVNTELAGRSSEVLINKYVIPYLYSGENYSVFLEKLLTVLKGLSSDNLEKFIGEIFKVFGAERIDGILKEELAEREVEERVSTFSCDKMKEVIKDYTDRLVGEERTDFLVDLMRLASSELPVNKEFVNSHVNILQSFVQRLSE